MAYFIANYSQTSIDHLLSVLDRATTLALHCFRFDLAMSQPEMVYIVSSKRIWRPVHY